MLTELINLVVYEWIGMDAESKFAGAVHFFLYDTIKIFLLLAAMIFVIGVLRTWLPEQKLKQWMSRGGIWGNLVAALFGAITPFCSCSSIPIFISLLRAGVPLGVTFSFLITSPIINEYLVVLMAGSFGIPITIAYVGSGLFIGTVAGALLGKMRLEKNLEQDIINAAESESGPTDYTLTGRLRYGWNESISVIKQIWIWVLVGVGIGAFIHNYVPQEMIHALMEKTGIFSVPIATTLGVPMYGSCAAIVPIAVVLFQKGIPIGTALAFMMAMAALSLPEAIMLRRTMNLKLIGIYFGITTLAIIFTGYLLNALAQYL
ncbi:MULTISPECIES: permease [unclassified Lentimonas]|uniref:permease n=1 Tax=unclassified Lentimonas TaxID=2630993 RepID=UPI0013241F8C|nr:MULTISPECIES: permease [unclassified Lentimonas]CAA6677344.1 Transporter [Lentimonas sp. CC4]CAA6686889.1 Transporter [Lentimonas sp. CC6]CAA7074590.1 Transporter [Lentimonas sp. CC4]CAA7169206.1 Transporter [Lentimonas sp. CC21]CAA7180393.1 Transporter [Lentimonas sp. CC8]